MAFPDYLYFMDLKQIGSEHICKNCKSHFTGKYCNTCGEKVFHEKDKSMFSLFEEAFHFITHFEGKFFITIRTMATKPGLLSTSYCNGVKKKFFKPISLFLLLVILYLMFPIFEGLNMKLYFHVRHWLYGGYATSATDRIMDARNITFDNLEDLFHQKSEKISKFLLFILIPFMALYSYAVGFKKRKFYFDHFIFCTELLSFFLLWGFLLLPFIIRFAGWIGFPQMVTSEGQTIFVALSLFLVYVISASHRFFVFKWWQAILFSVGYTFTLVIFLNSIYRLVLFWLSIQLV